MVAPKAKPPKLVGATLDSALARQARAKKNLVFVDVQLTAIQQQMEEARAEMVLADKAVNEARQLAVQDTVIFADVEVLVQAMRTQTLDPAAREDLARMTEALTSMRAMQQAQQPVSTPLTPMTPTVTQGTEPFPRTAGHAGSCAARSHATSGEHCSWTEPARLEDASGRAQALYGGGAARRTGERPWREVVGDRRGGPEQIRPSRQRQTCPLFERGIEKLDGGCRTQVRGELRWLMLTPEKWADRKRRWRTTPVFRIGEAKKPGPPDKLKTCPMCGAQCRLGKASGPFVKHKRRQSGDARRARTADTRKGYSSAKSAWDVERR